MVYNDGLWREAMWTYVRARIYIMIKILEIDEKSLILEILRYNMIEFMRLLKNLSRNLFVILRYYLSRDGTRILWKNLVEKLVILCRY